MLIISESSEEYYCFTNQVKGIEIFDLWWFVREKLKDSEDYFGKEFMVSVLFAS